MLKIGTPFAADRDELCELARRGTLTPLELNAIEIAKVSAALARYLDAADDTILRSRWCGPDDAV